MDIITDDGMSSVRFSDLDSLLSRPGPSGAQNNQISTLEEVIEKERIEEIISKKAREERHARRRL